MSGCSAFAWSFICLYTAMVAAPADSGSLVVFQGAYRRLCLYRPVAQAHGAQRAEHSFRLACQRVALGSRHERALPTSARRGYSYAPLAVPISLQRALSCPSSARSRLIGAADWRVRVPSVWAQIRESACCEPARAKRSLATGAARCAGDQGVPHVADAGVQVRSRFRNLRGSAAGLSLASDEIRLLQ